MNIYKPKVLDAFGSLKMKDVDFRVVFYKICMEIDHNKMFIETDFKDHEEHKLFLVKYIVQQFICMQTAQMSKQITYAEWDKILRTKLTKWIHFVGQ